MVYIVILYLRQSLRFWDTYTNVVLHAVVEIAEPEQVVELVENVKQPQVFLAQGQALYYVSVVLVSPKMR